MAHGATWFRRVSVGQEAGRGESMAPSLYWGFHRKEWLRQGIYADCLGLDSLNNLGGFRAIGVVPSCLALG